MLGKQSLCNLFAISISVQGSEHSLIQRQSAQLPKSIEDAVGRGPWAPTSSGWCCMLSASLHTLGTLAWD